MSHFSLLVITPERPNDADLHVLLQPYHEFSCTGIDDQYVVDIDKTEEIIAEYGSATRNYLRTANGILRDPYDDEFYREPTPEEVEKIGPMFGSESFGDISYHSRDWGDGKGYRPKVKFIPDGYEKCELPARETMPIREWLDYYHGYGAERQIKVGDIPDLAGPCKSGYAVFDGDNLVKFVDRDNPQHKWDWWQLGGRWSGLLEPSYDPAADPKNREVCWLCGGTRKRPDMECANGCNGCNGTGVMTKWPTQWHKDEDRDQKQIRDIDFKALRAYATAEALAKRNALLKVIGLDAKLIPNWPDSLDHAVNRVWWDNPVIKELQAAAHKRGEWLDRNQILGLRDSEEKAMERARLSAFCTFAVLWAGKWYQRGEMGWWGAVHHEEDTDTWQARFAEMLGQLRPTDWLSVIDCHT